MTAELEGFGVAVCTNNTVITNARINGKKDQHLNNIKKYAIGLMFIYSTCVDVNNILGH